MKRPYGTGQLYEKSGSFYGRWRTPDGRRLNRRIGSIRAPGDSDGITRAQAERMFRKVQADEATQSRAKAKRKRAVTVDFAANPLRERLAIEGARLSYRQNTESMQRIHVSPALGKRRIETVTSQDVERLARSMLARGLAHRPGRLLPGSGSGPGRLGDERSERGGGLLRRRHRGGRLLGRRRSVSVLFGLGDERLRRAVRTAHDEAVADALGYLERVAARGRRKHNGRAMVAGHGLIAAAFRHRTSRAGDPQLHTHVLVANVLEGVDGKWSALDGRGIYQHAKTAGYLYEAALRERLTTRLGVAWGPVRNGISDIDGVPAPVLRAFSRRRAEVEAELERRGESSAAARMATLATRRRKDYGVVPEQLVDEWRERAARLGFDRSALRDLLARRHDRRPAEWARAFRHLASSVGLTHRRATLARRDVLQALCEAVAPGCATVAQIEEAADRFMASELAVPLIAGDAEERLPTIRLRDGRLVYSRHAEGRYSTPEHLELERAIIETALDGAASGVAVADGRSLNRAMRRSLGDEQEAMVRRLASGGDRVAVVLGQVGTGKTYALRAAREAWEGTGISVVGAAISRRAARELEVGSGIPSTSVAALLQRVLVDDGLATRLGDLVGASRAAVRFEALRAQG